MKNVTVILPVFNEVENIEHIILAIEENNNSDFQFEILIIDDGSTDNTWKTVKSLSEKNQKIKALSLARNFGKEHAMAAGIKMCKTDLAIVMDSDLQHPPEVILQLLKKWQDTNCDVVHAVKVNRNNESSSGFFVLNIFYWIYKISTGTTLKGASDFKLLNRNALNSYSRLSERDLFFRGLIPWIGFKQETILFSVSKRAFGETKWNPFNRLGTAVYAITSFSALPLQLVTIAGALFFLSSIIFGTYTFYQWLTGAAVEGFTTIILLLLIIGSTLMVSLGIIGQYIARIYDEVKNRPNYIVKDKINL